MLYCCYFVALYTQKDDGIKQLIQSKVSTFPSNSKSSASIRPHLPSKVL